MFASTWHSCRQSARPASQARQHKISFTSAWQTKPYLASPAALCKGSCEPGVCHSQGSMPSKQAVAHITLFPVEQAVQVVLLLQLRSPVVRDIVPAGHRSALQDMHMWDVLCGQVASFLCEPPRLTPKLVSVLRGSDGSYTPNMPETGTLLQ